MNTFRQYRFALIPAMLDKVSQAASPVQADLDPSWGEPCSAGSAHPAGRVLIRSHLMSINHDSRKMCRAVGIPGVLSDAGTAVVAAHARYGSPRRASLKGCAIEERQDKLGFNLTQFLHPYATRTQEPLSFVRYQYETPYA